VNVTGSPELVLAETVKGGSAGFLSLSVPKVMLWSPLAIEKVRGTAPAAAQTPSPDWFAVIVHVPAPVIVTLEPATVHFPLAVNATGSPDVAVAETVNAPVPYTLSGKASNEIVCILRKFAVRFRGPDIVTCAGLVELRVPVKLPNTKPSAAAAVRETTVPWLKKTPSSASGDSDTVPLRAGEMFTLRACWVWKVAV
jgi:hypothetical protein